MLENSCEVKLILAYSNSSFNKLNLQLSEQLALLVKIKTALPEELGKHALHCVIGTKSITVFADSAAWATQLRFYSNAMLRAVNAASATGEFLSLRVKVLPAFGNHSQKRQASLPNLATAQALLAHSQSIEDHALRAALEKLSSTLVRLNTENA